MRFQLSRSRSACRIVVNVPTIKIRMPALLATVVLLAPAALAKRMGRASTDAGALLLELPTRLRRILDTMDGNGVEVHLRAAELDPLVARTERIGNRLVAGMITAALINAIGRFVAGDERWRSWRSALVGAGMTAASTLGGYLLWTARRRRR